MSQLNSNFALFTTIFSILNLAFIAAGIYCIVLFIQLATRGIKALDIYIEKNSGRNL